MDISFNIYYFREFHPLSLLIYYTLLAVSLFSCGYNTYLIYAFISLSVCAIAAKGPKAYAKSLVYYMLLTAVTAVFNVIFNHSGSHAFLYVNNIPLTLEALFYGLYTGIFVCCLLIWFSCFNYSVDNGKINYLAGRRLKTTGLILSMAFGFMDKFRYKLGIIRQTLYTQGYTTVNLRYGAAVFSLLLSVMLEDSAVAADSMTARGYVSGKRRSYRRYKFGKKDGALIVISAALSALSLSFGPFTALLALVPVIYNIYKELLWKYYQLKI